MKKKNINELILYNALGKLTEEEQHELNEWLSSDSSHRAQYDKLMQEDKITERMRIYNSLDVESAWNKFYKISFGKKKIKRIKYYWCAASLLILFAFSITFFIYQKKTEPSLITKVEKHLIERSINNGRTKATFIVSGNKQIKLSPKVQNKIAEGAPMPKEFFDKDVTIKTDVGKEFWITLEDGTRVHLNYDTYLKYPANFDSDNRTVYVEGEAFFEVQHNEKRPFYVRTANGIVKDYGTSFNVNTNSKSETTEIILVSGKVSAITNDGKEYPMNVGQMAELKNGCSDVQLKDVDINSYISWNTGNYIFDACSMEKLMNVLSHWYGKRVVFKNNETRSIEFSGRIDRYNELDATLEAIKYIIKHNIYIENDIITIQ